MTGATESQFLSYCGKLEHSGYSLVMENETTGSDGNANLFRRYLASDRSHSVYTYYLAAYGEVRIIVDTQEDTVTGYNYDEGKNVTTPKMVMWGLSTSPSGYHIDTSVEGANTGRENNGALIIIRMKDNSLFFYDGGILAQMSDEESAELLAFCRELTGAKVGEKMVINTWFVSHAHDDHFQAFGRFININHEHFDLKNVVYNIDLERRDVTALDGDGTTPASKNLREALNVIRTWYPDVSYYKPHTGETFTVAGIGFDVMYTHEDRLLPDSNGNLSFETDVLGAANSLGKRVDIYDVGGTYRDELYMRSGDNYLTYNGEKRSDFNDTSTVLRVNFENGVDSILYADLNLSESIVKSIHPASSLKTDIMLVPHHGFEAHTDLVSYAKAKIYLYAQSKAAVYGSDGNYKTYDAGDRDGLRNNFDSMKTVMDSVSGTEGTDYHIFWGGSETVSIDIDALGRDLGYTPSTRTAESYYTAESAQSFGYTGWSLTDEASAEYQSVVNSTSHPLEKEDAVAIPVSSPSIAFVRAPEPFKQEGRYLLMSDKYGYIMSFDSTAAPEIPSGDQHGTSFTGSILLDADGDSMNTYYMVDDTVILDNSDRHFAIWNLRQYAQATGGDLKLDGTLLAASSNTTFGGTAQYAGVELQKRTAYHDSYWYNKYFDEATVAGSDFQLRFMCFLSDTTFLKNYYKNALQCGITDKGDQTAKRVKFILDSLGDNTYLIYFKENNSDYRVLTCDANGKWEVIRYKDNSADHKPVSQMKADVQAGLLQIRLYEYKETDAHKTVAFYGPQKYYVDLNDAVSSINTDIGNSITVFDPSHQSQHIPYDGSEILKTNIGGTEYPVTQKAGYYWLDSTDVNTSVAGEYPVLIKYRNDDGTDTTIGQVSVIVGADYAKISADNKTGTVLKNSSVSTVVNAVFGQESVPARFTLNGGEPISVTVGMLTDSEGNRIDTSATGTYKNLTLTYQGTVICEDFTLNVVPTDKFMDYPKYDEPGSVKVDKGSTTPEEEFAGTGVANIELSATAKPVEKGVDLIFIVDLSSSMRYHVNNSDYACGPKYFPNGELNDRTTSDYTTTEDQLTHVYNEEWWQYTRMAAMENALISMIGTLSASGTDVKIAIADFGDLDHYEFEDAVLDDTIGAPAGAKPYWDANRDDTGTLNYEMSNHVNFVLGADDPSFKDANETGAFMSQPYWLDQTKHNDDYTNKHGWTYTGKVLPMIFTGDGTLSSGAFMDVSALNNQQKLEELTDAMKKQNGKRLGTNYDIGLETAYRLAYAREQANIAAGEERDIICIFMSDGAAMQYNYLSGRSQTEAWSQCIIGETDEILDAQNVADKYVITSDPYDTSVKQNPNLQAMMKDLLQVLDDGNLLKPGTTTLYPNWDKDNSYKGTDFFLAMKSIGVDCDWELTWQIAYTLYEHHKTNNGHGVSFPDGTTLYGGQQILDKVVMSLRAPSFDASGKQYKYQTLSPYYYFYHKDGKNWWAEALKGDSAKLYPVISKFAFKDSTEWGEDVDFYYGDVRNNFVGETTKTYDKNGNQTGTLALEGKDYVAGFRGLDMDLYTVGFSLGTENQIEYTEASKVLENIASGPAYHFEAVSGEALTECLQAIASTVSTSATRAWFTDEMGDDYDLSTERTAKNEDGETITINAGPTIRVLEYNLEKVTGDNGEETYIRTGEPNVREVITFEDMDDDGDTDAWSNRVHTSSVDASGNETRVYPNIWDETTNMITGQYVRYNANKYVDESNTGAVDLYLDDTGRKYSLAAESFFWTIGMIGETEMVLEYQVYLEGSIEGDLPLPKTYYDTNEEAILHYINYLGNNCELDTVTPKFPWGEKAVVSGGFYLVDENGNPITEDGTTTDFSGSEKLGNVLIFVVNEDGTYTLDAETLAAMEEAGLDTDLYELYDPSADYKLTYNQVNDGSGNWVITVGESKNNTTYVTGYGEGKEPTNVPSNTAASGDGQDLSNTTVFFAVRLKAKAQPDTVVIDYGLPVEIEVLGNDDFTVNGNAIQAELVSVAWNVELPKNGFTTAPGSAFGGSQDGIHGSIAVEDSVTVKYLLDSMEMPSEDVFVYAAKDTTNGRYYYSTVTIIPATTIYYEDGFLTYSVIDDDTGETVENYGWTTAGKTQNKVQAEDRPGPDVTALDADNIYGYDGAYTAMTEYSQGSAAMVNVGYKYNNDGSAVMVPHDGKQEPLRTTAIAEFTFSGTGFDVVSLTSAKTGTILVEVQGVTDASFNEIYIVDTYYGYKLVDGEWVVDKDDTSTDGNDLYQVPVMKVDGLTYGKYNVKIIASWAELFDHDQYGDKQNYDFYLDAIRIYDPANDGAGNKVIEDAYVDDGEGWPEYFELRDLLINANDFNSLDGESKATGIVFIDNTADKTTNTNDDVTYSVADYKNYGPNNELYLAKNQAVTFTLNVGEVVNGESNVAGIHIAMKSTGGTANAVIKKTSGGASPAEPVLEQEIKTATDLYYDITAANGYTVVIQNTGDDILSITNIKVTYKSAHEDSIENDYFRVTKSGVQDALNLLAEDDLRVTSGALTPESATLSLEDEVHYNIYFSSTTGASAENMGLLVWDSKPASPSYANADEIYEGVKNENSRYKVTTDGIPAKEMGDTKYFMLYAKNTDGSYTYSEMFEYSAKTYAVNKLNSTASSEKLKNLCVALLNYGAAAQTYFGYRTGDLMNAGLTATQKDYVQSYSADLLDDVGTVAEEKIGEYAATAGAYIAKQATVTLGGALELNFYFTPSKTTDAITLYYWNEVAYASEEALSSIAPTGTIKMENNGGKFRGTVTGIAAKNMDDTIYVCGVYEVDGVKYSTGIIPYSIAAYCEKKAANGDEAIVPLAKATVVYGYYAKTYFAP